jgi:hypothetical protein
LVLPREPTQNCIHRTEFNSPILPFAEQSQARRLQSASIGPYIRLWNIGSSWNENDYFALKRNKCITFQIGVGVPVNYTLEMNVLIDILSFAF